MVIIYGGVIVDPERVAEVARAAVPFQASCRDEDGCLEYTLAWEVAEPNRIRLVEVWQDVGAYEAHRAREHVREWTSFISGASLGAPAFTRHDVPIAA